MKILRLQLSPNKKSTLTGFIISALLHSTMFVALVNFHTFTLKPAGKDSVKISLNTFKAPPAPTPPAPVASPTPPAPVVEQIKPLTPPEIIKPQEKPKEIVKKVEQKPIAKKPAKKKEKVAKQVEEVAPTPPVTQSSEVASDISKAIDSAPAVASSSEVANTNLAPSGTTSTSETIDLDTIKGDPRFDKIRDLIERSQSYPEKARKMRKQGIAKVSFAIKRDGSVSDVKIVESSGTSILDKDAINAVKKASKNFPMLDSNYIMAINLKYTIN